MVVLLADDEVPKFDQALREEQDHANEQRAEDELPEAALETAALLRFSRDRAELGEERADAILEGVLSELADARPATAAEPAQSPRSVRALGWWTSLAAGAFALMFYFAGAPTPSRQPVREVALPPVPLRVLQAQAQAMALGGDVRTLSDAMRPFRTAMFDVAQGEQR
ncbi:MAG: hypothetical protein HRU16_04025 [Planctomycetes bacterium]|nr:hypothetical protein [Planctomycetota bacterium]